MLSFLCTNITNRKKRKNEMNTKKKKKKMPTKQKKACLVKLLPGYYNNIPFVHFMRYLTTQIVVM